MSLTHNIARSATVPRPPLPGTKSLPTQLTLAYGLNVQSELPLPEFTPLHGEDHPVDVRIRFASGQVWIPEVREKESSWRIESRDAHFWFRGVGGFRVRDGCEIIVSPEPGIDNELLRMYVEGMMMATLLYQRGFFVLHASVVKIGDMAVAFLGHVGAGKSSTAAALYSRGHAVVTDDNAAIQLATATPLVTPAFPYVKVFPAIGASLGFPAESLRRMHVSQPKCAGALSGNFPAQPVPLSRIYVLSRETEQPLTPIARGEVVIELIRNSVPTRWRQPGGADHLAQCTELATRTPAFRVRTFDELSELPELAQRIERHNGFEGA